MNRLKNQVNQNTTVNGREFDFDGLIPSCRASQSLSIPVTVVVERGDSS